MELKYILLEKKDGIATITFHRPEALNALNSDVLNDLNAAVDDVAADDAVRVVVFTGEGKSFIAGADLKEMDGDTAMEAIRYSRKGAAVFRKIELISLPLLQSMAMRSAAALSLYFAPISVLQTARQSSVCRRLPLALPLALMEASVCRNVLA